MFADEDAACSFLGRATAPHDDNVIEDNCQAQLPDELVASWPKPQLATTQLYYCASARGPTAPTATSVYWQNASPRELTRQMAGRKKRDQFLGRV